MHYWTVFDGVTSLIPQFEHAETFGRWEDLGLHAGTKEDPHPLPHVSCDDDIDIYDLMLAVSDSIANMTFVPYDPVFDEAKDILDNMEQVFRGERISDGTILECCESGQMLKWMKRLEELDDERLGKHALRAILRDQAADKGKQTSKVDSGAERRPAETATATGRWPKRLSDQEEQAIKDDPDAEYYRFDFGERYVKVKRAEGLYYSLTVKGEWVEYSKAGNWFWADDRIYEEI